MCFPRQVMRCAPLKLLMIAGEETAKAVAVSWALR